MPLRLASSYNWSRVRPPSPEWERCPPRLDAGMSRRDCALACFASPCWARSLLTVRAAISSATFSLLPRDFTLSLMCSYWRSRLPLQALGMSFSSMLALGLGLGLGLGPAGSGAIRFGRGRDVAERHGHVDLVVRVLGCDVSEADDADQPLVA